MTHWQAKLARVPRWAWVAFAICVISPIVVLGAMMVTVVVTTALIVFVAVLLIGGILSLAWKLMHRRRPIADGRKNVQIVVHSARVIDP